MSAYHLNDLTHLGIIQSEAGDRNFPYSVWSGDLGVFHDLASMLIPKSFKGPRRRKNRISHAPNFHLEESHDEKCDNNKKDTKKGLKFAHLFLTHSWSPF